MPRAPRLVHVVLTTLCLTTSPVLAAERFVYPTTSTPAVVEIKGFGKRPPRLRAAESESSLSAESAFYREKPVALPDVDPTAPRSIFPSDFVTPAVARESADDTLAPVEEADEPQEAGADPLPTEEMLQDPFVEEVPVETVPAPVEPSPKQEAKTFGLRPMTSLTTNIAVPPSKENDEIPANVAAPRFAEEGIIAHAGSVGRNWAITDYRWEASMLCHGPVLFEQLNAERYGITYGYLQPVVSGAHFFVTLPVLPYKVWAQGHDTRQYALGYYRPGSYAKPQCYKPRYSADASLFEAGVILGLIYILP